MTEALRIAKALSERQVDALLYCNPIAGAYAEPRTVKALVARGLYSHADGITDFGKEVREYIHAGVRPI